MKSPQKEMEDGVWLIKDGKTTLVLSAKDLGGIPNGITLSPDEKWLYLSAFKKMMRYAVWAGPHGVHLAVGQAVGNHQPAYTRGRAK
jgi:sugar lactone lactonase YvrE